MNEFIDPDTGEVTFARPIMPPEIAKAVVAVMGKIKPLAKEGNNTFQRYRFTSVDQFFEAVGPLMSEAGIFTVLFEGPMQIVTRESTDDRGNTKSSVWLVAQYDVWIYHESGASYGPLARSIQVLASGPQSYASAQSFIEKYFLRSLFKIPTGDDDDADAQRKEPLPPTPPKPEPKIDLAQAKQIRDLLKSVGGSQKVFAEFYKIDRLTDLPASRFQEAVDWINEAEPEPVSKDDVNREPSIHGPSDEPPAP